MIVFPECSYEFVKLHCNSNIGLYVDPPEISMVQRYFRNATPKNILELGCGLGRVSLGFYKKFKNWRDTNFWLADGDSGHIQIADVDSPNRSYYNDLKATYSFCYRNGIPNKQIKLINTEYAEPFDDVKIKFDFVYSFLAIGFHWPIDWYLKRIDPFIRSGTILIFGIRPDDKPRFRRFNTLQISAIPDCFYTLETVTNRGQRNNFIVLRRR